MSGYHSTELCYLAAVYTNLLVTKQPMDLYFRPNPGGFKDNILRVSPDILPPGSIRIGEVWIDGEPYPTSTPRADGPRPRRARSAHKIRVRVVPTIDPFEVDTKFDGGVAEMTLTGKLDTSTFGIFQAEVEAVLAKKPGRLVLYLKDLDSIANVGIRVLLFARQRMDISDRADIYAVAPNPAVREALRSADPDQEDINVVESYDPFRDPDGLGKKPDWACPTRTSRSSGAFDEVTNQGRLERGRRDLRDGLRPPRSGQPGNPCDRRRRGREGSTWRRCAVPFRTSPSRSRT